jgi:excisionase family DNA binding protein
MDTETLESPYLSAEQVARFLNVSRAHILRLVRIGEIPSVKIGQVIRIPASYLKQFEEK